MVTNSKISSRGGRLPRIRFDLICGIASPAESASCSFVLANIDEVVADTRSEPKVGRRHCNDSATWRRRRVTLFCCRIEFFEFPTNHEDSDFYIPCIGDCRQEQTYKARWCSRSNQIRGKHARRMQAASGIKARRITYLFISAQRSFQILQYSTREVSNKARWWSKAMEERKPLHDV